MILMVYVKIKRNGALSRAIDFMADFSVFCLGLESFAIRAYDYLRVHCVAIKQGRDVLERAQ